MDVHAALDPTAVELEFVTERHVEPEILSRSPANETDRTERGVLTKDRRLGSLEHLDPLYVEDRRNQVARMRRVNAVDKAGHRCFDRENSCVRSQPSDRRRCSAANRVIQLEDRKS